MYDVFEQNFLIHGMPNGTPTNRVMRSRTQCMQLTWQYMLRYPDRHPSITAGYWNVLVRNGIVPE